MVQGGNAPIDIHMNHLIRLNKDGECIRDMNVCALLAIPRQFMPIESILVFYQCIYQLLVLLHYQQDIWSARKHPYTMQRREMISTITTRVQGILHILDPPNATSEECLNTEHLVSRMFHAIKMYRMVPNKDIKGCFVQPRHGVPKIQYSAKIEIDRLNVTKDRADCTTIEKRIEIAIVQFQHDVLSGIEMFEQEKKKTPSLTCHNHTESPFFFFFFPDEMVSAPPSPFSIFT